MCTCPAIFLMPFVSINEIMLCKSLWCHGIRHSQIPHLHLVLPFLSFSFSLCLSLSWRVLCGTYASECYTGWQIIMAHILSAPRLQGIVPEHTMVPGPVSATHPCPSLLVRARGIVSLSGSPLSHLHSGFCRVVPPSVAANKSTLLLKQTHFDLFAALPE